MFSHCDLVYGRFYVPDRHGRTWECSKYKGCDECEAGVFSDNIKPRLSQSRSLDPWNITDNTTDLLILNWFDRVTYSTCFWIAVAYPSKYTSKLAAWIKFVWLIDLTLTAWLSAWNSLCSRLLLHWYFESHYFKPAIVFRPTLHAVVGSHSTVAIVCVIRKTRKPCYRKDDRAMRPMYTYKLFTLILLTLIRSLYYARILILNEFELRKFCLFLQDWRFGRSRSSEVIDVGANGKRVCDFLLVRKSNLGPILHHFGDMTAPVLLAPRPLPLFYRNFGDVPVAPDRPCWCQPAHKP